MTFDKVRVQFKRLLLIGKEQWRSRTRIMVYVYRQSRKSNPRPTTKVTFTTFNIVIRLEYFFGNCSWMRHPNRKCAAEEKQDRSRNFMLRGLQQALLKIVFEIMGFLNFIKFTKNIDLFFLRTP